MIYKQRVQQNRRQIIAALLEHNVYTPEMLSAIFNISIRQIYKDLKSVKEMKELETECQTS
jgi:DeoR/GlpR family transcriptional regulator of sugar metabolism